MTAVLVGVDAALEAWFAAAPAQGSTLRAKRAAVRDWAVWLGEVGVSWAAAEAVNLVDSWSDDNEGKMSSTWLVRRRNYITGFCAFVQSSGLCDDSAPVSDDIEIESPADTEGPSEAVEDVAAVETVAVAPEVPAAGDVGGSGRALEALEELVVLGRSVGGR